MDLKKAGDSESDSKSNSLFGDAAEGMDLAGGDVHAGNADAEELTKSRWMMSQKLSS